jgi:hypothetical protein
VGRIVDVAPYLTADKYKYTYSYAVAYVFHGGVWAVFGSAFLETSQVSRCNCASLLSLVFVLLELRRFKNYFDFYSYFLKKLSERF